MLAVWAIGGLFALCGALTLAEIAGAFPETGGLYIYIREGWGRLPAFLFGWSELVLIRAASLGAVSTTCAEYGFRLFGRDPAAPEHVGQVHYVAAATIALTAFFNYRGLRWGSAVQNITTFAKYGGLLFIVLVALALGLPSTGGHYTPVIPAGSLHAVPFGLALVSVLWAFDGWADLSFVAGEVKDPRRILPRALIGGTLAVVAIYLLANIAYLAVLPVSEIARSQARGRRRGATRHGDSGRHLRRRDRRRVDIRYAQRFAPDLAPDFLRDGRGPSVLPARGRASTRDSAPPTWRSPCRRRSASHSFSSARSSS